MVSPATSSVQGRVPLRQAMVEEREARAWFSFILKNTNTLFGVIPCIGPRSRTQRKQTVHFWLEISLRENQGGLNS